MSPTVQSVCSAALVSALAGIDFTLPVRITMTINVPVGYSGDYELDTGIGDHVGTGDDNENLFSIVRLSLSKLQVSLTKDTPFYSIIYTTPTLDLTQPVTVVWQSNGTGIDSIINGVTHLFTGVTFGGFTAKTFGFDYTVSAVTFAGASVTSLRIENF